jgi:hypothetical protein
MLYVSFIVSWHFGSYKFGSNSLVSTKVSKCVTPGKSRSITPLAHAAGWGGVWIEEMTNRTGEKLKIDIMAFLKEEFVKEHQREGCRRVGVTEVKDSGK